MSKPTDDKSTTELSDAERKALIKAQRQQQAQEEALNDIRAEQQMIEGAVDTDESVRRMEQLRRSGNA